MIKVNRLIVAALLCAIGGTLFAQIPRTERIKLAEPNKQRGLPLMQALSVRASARGFSREELSLQDLSDLLWAANGVNRPESGLRTASSAWNKQDVMVYVLFNDAAYRYEAKTQELVLVARVDLRAAAAGGQATDPRYDPPMKELPLYLVLVSDTSKFPKASQAQLAVYGALDTGIVSQNISIFAAATGIGTVPRLTMDAAALSAGLKLTPAQLPLMNHPVGYHKKTDSKN